MRSKPSRDRSTHAPAPAHRQQPLGEDRYKELLSRANAFFSTAERDVDAERLAAIEEIKSLMAEYGLTPQDLMAD